MDETYYLVLLLSPYVSISEQQPIHYFTTGSILDSFAFGCIKLDSKNLDFDTVISRRYLKGAEKVVVYKIKDYEKIENNGIIETYDTVKGLVKIIYTTIKAKIIYFKCYKGRLFRAYFVELTNLGKVNKDGYIPLDKSIGLGNVLILEHNKRKLIKRGAVYLHNRLCNIMAYVDKEFKSIEEMDSDFDSKEESVNLKALVQSIIDFE